MRPLRILKTVITLTVVVSCIFFFISLHRTSPPVTHEVIFKDWHNYNQIEEDRKRSGYGEQGRAVYLSDHVKTSEKTLDLRLIHGFEAVISDMIALNRAIPDVRPTKCANMRYRAVLPSVSVVIPTSDEHLQTMARTIVSIINRSPPELLKEIIIVDDGSTINAMKKPLSDYLAANQPKVKLLRLPQRQGLAPARQAGAKIAVGDILIFLDSHCEANVNWLPPLIDPIVEDYRTVTCPFIDAIAHDTLAYNIQDEGGRGAFNWNFLYKRLPLLPDDKLHPERPFDSPVMAGGLFAISSRWFWELGGYDPGIVMWGGEQYELSFKTWMCGGRMIDVPCSHVGHIYRGFSMRPKLGGIPYSTVRNHKRVAEVWMDDYKKYIYMRNPIYKEIDTGNLTEQKELRRRLKCRSFEWFMTNVAFDLISNYPTSFPGNLAWGQLKNRQSSNKCLHITRANGKGAVVFGRCTPKNDLTGSTDDLIWDGRGAIHLKSDPTMCLDAIGKVGTKVSIYGCHHLGGHQFWSMKMGDHLIVHDSGLCLNNDPSKNVLTVDKCEPNSATFFWQWDHVNKTAVAFALKEA